MLDVEPAWDIAKIFPAQGTWAEEDYLLLPGFTVDVDACFAEGEQ
jgi:hypothetical protein